MQNDSKLKSDSKNKLWCSHIGLYRIERTTDTTLYGTHIKIRYTPEMQQLFKPTSHPIGGGGEQWYTFRNSGLSISGSSAPPPKKKLDERSLTETILYKTTRSAGLLANIHICNDHFIAFCYKAVLKFTECDDLWDIKRWNRFARPMMFDFVVRWSESCQSPTVAARLETGLGLYGTTGF